MTAPDDLDYSLDLVRAESFGERGADALADLAQLEKPGAPFAGDPRIMLEQANAYNALGEYPQVLAAAKQAQQNAAARGARLLEAAADLSLCWAQHNLGAPDATLCQQSYDIYRVVGDKLNMARAQTALGNQLADQSKYAGALAKYRDAADLTQSIGARGDKAGALLNIARMQNYLGQLPEEKDLAHTAGDLAAAQDFLDSALKAAEVSSNKDLIARAYSFQAAYAFESGAVTAALASAAKCIQLRSETQMSAETAYCQQTRGDILLAQNQIPDARSAYQAAEQLYQAAKDPGSTAAVWISQAELAAQTGSPAEAEPLARAAAAEFAGEKDTIMQASALSALLHSLVAQGKRAEADQTWQSLSQLHPNDPDAQHEVAMAEARYRAMLGAFDVALARVAQARDYCHQHGRVDCELPARLLAGQIDAVAGKTDGLSAELQSLSADASRYGFALIAQQATQTLASPSLNALF
jgi:tetratricopeptide (TPR) repeat protein